MSVSLKDSVVVQHCLTDIGMSIQPVPFLFLHIQIRHQADVQAQNFLIVRLLLPGPVQIPGKTKIILGIINIVNPILTAGILLNRRIQRISVCLPKTPG